MAGRDGDGNRIGVRRNERGGGVHERLPNLAKCPSTLTAAACFRRCSVASSMAHTAVLIYSATRRSRILTRRFRKRWRLRRYTDARSLGLGTVDPNAGSSPDRDGIGLSVSAGRNRPIRRRERTRPERERPARTIRRSGFTRAIRSSTCRRPTTRPIRRGSILPGCRATMPTALAICPASRKRRSSGFFPGRLKNGWGLTHDVATRGNH